MHVNKMQNGVFRWHGVAQNQCDHDFCGSPTNRWRAALPLQLASRDCQTNQSAGNCKGPELSELVILVHEGSQKHALVKACTTAVLTQQAKGPRS